MLSHKCFCRMHMHIYIYICLLYEIFDGHKIYNVMFHLPYCNVNTRVLIELLIVRWLRYYIKQNFSTDRCHARVKIADDIAAHMDLTRKCAISTTTSNPLTSHPLHTGFRLYGQTTVRSLAVPSYCCTRPQLSTLHPADTYATLQELVRRPDTSGMAPERLCPLSLSRVTCETTLGTLRVRSCCKYDNTFVRCSCCKSRLIKRYCASRPTIVLSTRFKIPIARRRMIQSDACCKRCDLHSRRLWLTCKLCNSMSYFYLYFIVSKNVIAVPEFIVFYYRLIIIFDAVYFLLSIIIIIYYCKLYKIIIIIIKVYYLLKSAIVCV
jgi:hypothetical protein